MNEILITQACLEKMYNLVKAGLPHELSMFGEVEITETEQAISLKLVNVAVPKQKRTGTTIEHINGNGSYKFLEDQGVDPSKLKCWIHSHPTFSTNPSGTDNKTFEEMTDGNKLFIMLIVSIKYDPYCRIKYKNFSFEAKLKVEGEEESLKEEKKLITDATIISPTFERIHQYTIEDQYDFYRGDWERRDKSYKPKKTQTKTQTKNKKKKLISRNKLPAINEKYFDNKVKELHTLDASLEIEIYESLLDNSIKEVCTCVNNCDLNCARCNHLLIEKIFSEEMFEELKQGMVEFVGGDNGNTTTY